MSLTLKLTSLLIRTASKPIGNYIKRQAREHPTFRATCVSFAQRLHRLDMRMRLGLLQDPAIIERQITRETEKAEKERKAKIAAAVAASNPGAPSRTSYDVPTKAESEEAILARKQEERDAERKVREDEAQRLEKIRIRPLSEAKAIDSGANFVSEAFLFLVAGGLILFESLRSRRKEASRREDIKERIEKLEAREREFEEKEQEFERMIMELRSLPIATSTAKPMVTDPRQEQSIRRR